MNADRLNQKRRCIAGTGLVVAIAIAACGRSNDAAQTPKPPPAEPPLVEVVHIIERPIDVTLDMPGELEAFESVDVFPKVTGFVKRVGVDRGSRVRAGEVLVELEAPELLAARAEADAKLQAAEAELGVAGSKVDSDTSTFERLKAAAATPGVVAGNDLMVAQKTVEADQNQMTAARRNIDAARQARNAVTQMEGYLRVTAPFDGVVTERNVHDGALVGPNSGGTATPPMVKVVKSDRLRLTVPLPEAYTAGVSEGVSIAFTVSAYPGQIFSGTVARLAHAVDVNTRTMAVELDVVNRDGKLAPGTFCQVRWPVRRPAPSLFAPAASVTNTTGRTFVVRIRDGRTEWIDVKTGLSSGPLIEVFGDLRAGDTIAARGTDEIRPGTGVRVKESQPAVS